MTSRTILIGGCRQGHPLLSSPGFPAAPRYPWRSRLPLLPDSAAAGPVPGMRRPGVSVRRRPRPSAPGGRPVSCASPVCTVVRPLCPRDVALRARSRRSRPLSPWVSRPPGARREARPYRWCWGGHRSDARGALSTPPATAVTTVYPVQPCRAPPLSAFLPRLGVARVCLARRALGPET